MPVTPVPSDPTVGSDHWNRQQRDEAPLRRADRNFLELLQELRVVLTGVQIVFGFLLTASFTERLAHLLPMQRGVFVVTLLSAAVTSVLLVAPVAAHRCVFQRGCKREVVRFAHGLILCGLTTLALTLVSGIVLVLDLAIGRWPAVIGGVSFVVVVALLWVAGPVRRLPPAARTRPGNHARPRPTRRPPHDADPA